MISLKIEQQLFQKSYAKAQTGFTCLLLCCLTFFSCVQTQVPEEPVPVTFALFGDTNPESPFSNISRHVRTTLKSIKDENPAFVVHLGNIAYGGSEWMGIKPGDVVRQYREFMNFNSLLRMNIFTVRGNLDHFNQKTDIYSDYTGRPPYYSFNYGNLHFIVLDTSDPEPGSVSEKQLQWLAEDLKNNRRAQAIFVFTHHPLIKPGKAPFGGKMVREPQRIITKLHGFPVKAIFSGHWKGHYTDLRNGIYFIVAGCNGFNAGQYYRNNNQFYMVSFNGRTITVVRKKINYNN